MGQGWVKWTRSPTDWAADWCGWLRFVRVRPSARQPNLCGGAREISICMGERAELLIRGVDFIEGSTISERVSVRRPRILSDIVLAPLEDGVVIDGLARQEMIRGPVAQIILPDLIKLLDGTRTVEDLASG
jgi:hypothetical protein